MTPTDITRLANQMLAVEKDQNEELAQKHADEWARLPYNERWLVVEESKRIETRPLRLVRRVEQAMAAQKREPLTKMADLLAETESARRASQREIATLRRLLKRVINELGETLSPELREAVTCALAGQEQNTARKNNDMDR